MGADGPVYRWEFERRGRAVTVSVSGPLIVCDVELTLRAALDGVGLAFELEEHAAENIAREQRSRRWSTGSGLDRFSEWPHRFEP
jgi:hypothetical protein